MKKDYILGILFFGSLWGAQEALLGGYLYAKSIPHASVPITIIGFMILTVARIYLPRRGSSTLIGAIAMLYKFLNTPFFACHLLAIFLLGASYDLVFSFLKIKSKAASGLIATYLGYILFAFTITYIFKYHYWIQEGLPKVLRYIGTSGTLTALANTVAVPVSFYIGCTLKERAVNPFEFRSKLATSSISLVTLLIWVAGVARWF